MSDKGKYWKTIDVKVIDIKRGGHAPYYKTLEITVKSEEYDLKETFYYKNGWVWEPPFWNVKKGDVIKAELHSWKIDSTGEIIDREIAELIED